MVCSSLWVGGVALYQVAVLAGWGCVESGFHPLTGITNVTL